GPQRLEDVLLVVVDREEHHPRLGDPPGEPAAQVEAALRAEPHVQQDDVGAQRGHQPGRLVSRPRLAHDAHAAGEPGQHRLQPGEDHLVVVDQDDAYGDSHSRTITTASYWPVGNPRRRCGGFLRHFTPALPWMGEERPRTRPVLSYTKTEFRRTEGAEGAPSA